MIKYMTRSGCAHRTITAHEVLRETAHWVVLATEYATGTRKCLKRGVYENWHDTWEDAKQFLVAEVQGEVDFSESKLADARTLLAHIQAMTAPE